MSKVLLVAERGTERFEIVDDGCGEGVLAFRYVAGQNTHNYFQPDVPVGQLCAQEQWGLEPSAWRGAVPGQRPLSEKNS